MEGSVGFEPTEHDWLRFIPLQTERIKPDSANYPKKMEEDKGVEPLEAFGRSVI